MQTVDGLSIIGGYAYESPDAFTSWNTFTPCVRAPTSVTIESVDIAHRVSRVLERGMGVYTLLCGQIAAPACPSDCVMLFSGNFSVQCPIAPVTTGSFALQVPVIAALSAAGQWLRSFTHP